MALRIFILTGAAAAAAQAGAAPSATFSTSVTSFTATGVVQQASSFIYGAVIHGNSADTASGGVTVVDDIADATNGERYCTFKKITGVTAGSQALGTTAGSSTGGAAWLEALASGTLAEDPAAGQPAGGARLGGRRQRRQYGHRHRRRVRLDREIQGQRGDQRLRRRVDR